LAENFSGNVRGEIVLLISGQAEASGVESVAGGTRSEELLKRVQELAAEGVDSKTALKTAARELGFKRDEAYRLVMLQKNQRSK